MDESVTASCVTEALGQGINYLDTADVYAGTKAEPVPGRALRGVRRESYVPATNAYFPVGTWPVQRAARVHPVLSERQSR